MSDSPRPSTPTSDADETPAELVARLEAERRSWRAIIADARSQQREYATIVRRGTQALHTINAELRVQRVRLRQQRSAPGAASRPAPDAALERQGRTRAAHRTSGRKTRA